MAYYYKGEKDKAIEYLEKSLQIKLKTVGNNNPDTYIYYHNIGMAFDSKGENDKAIRIIRITIKIRSKTLEINHPSQKRLKKLEDILENCNYLLLKNYFFIIWLFLENFNKN